MSGYVPTAGPILTGAAATYLVAWKAFYLRGGRTLTRDTLGFWAGREAKDALPWLLPRQCAYVRIQSWVDHAQYPTYLRCQKATKALQAAYQGIVKNHPHCYYADSASYYADHTSLTPSYIGPASWATTTWTDTNPCTDWPQLPREDAWAVQVDLVRWAMSSVFTY